MSDELSEHEELRRRRLQVSHEAGVSQRLKDTGRERTRAKGDAALAKPVVVSSRSARCPACKKMIPEPYKRPHRMCPHCGAMTPF
jgi:hypothetical protein